MASHSFGQKLDFASFKEFRATRSRSIDSDRGIGKQLDEGGVLSHQQQVRIFFDLSKLVGTFLRSSSQVTHRLRETVHGSMVLSDLETHPFIPASSLHFASHGPDPFENPLSGNVKIGLLLKRQGMLRGRKKLPVPGVLAVSGRAGRTGFTGSSAYAQAPAVATSKDRTNTRGEIMLFTPKSGDDPDERSSPYGRVSPGLSEVDSAGSSSPLLSSSGTLFCFSRPPPKMPRNLRNMPRRGLL